MDIGDTACKGWARWRLHRGQGPVVIRSGCTEGEQPASSKLPKVWFLPADAQAGTPLLAAVPADTCRYELREPERGEVRGTVVPVFSKNVIIERVVPDLLAVHSTYGHDTTKAYQLQTLDSTQPGPVFMLAERNDGDEAREGATAKVVSSRSDSDARVLLDAVLMPEEDGIPTFASDGRTLDFQEMSTRLRLVFLHGANGCVTSCAKQ